MKHLTVTADDFGLSVEVNEAVEIAHRTGILTAASLMVAGRAAADAIVRAKKMPGLRVGLHLTLVEGDPTLPGAAIPGLVRPDGLLRTDMAAMSFALLTRPALRRQLAAEITAQFDAFRATGLALDHVNAHKHFHINPLVAGALLRIGPAFGMRRLRAPREPTALLRSLEPTKRPAVDRAAVFLAGRLARRARQRNLVVDDRVFGLAWSGAMTGERLTKLVEALPEGTNEIYTHPAVAGSFSGSAPGYRYADELAALTAPEVLSAVRAADINLRRS